MTSRILTRLAPIALLCLLFATVGCGSRGTLSGKVTYKNKAVVWGSVSVIARDNIQYAGEITPAGTYSIANVPSGSVKIAVVSPNPDTSGRPSPGGGKSGQGDGDGAGAGAERPPVPKGAWMALPEKYTDPMQSGLTATVKGATQHDIKLD